MIAETLDRERLSLANKSTCQRNLYRSMHNSHLGYMHRNQGVAVMCDWLHLLKDKNNSIHNPWTDTPISIIEVGCGNGMLCDLLGRMSFDVTGIDIFDGHMYDRTRYKFLEHDMTVTPYPYEDNQFDYCVSFDVLEHLYEKNIDATLSEMARISRNMIIKVASSGTPPLHLTVKSPGWWLEKLIKNCPDFSWSLVRNYERVGVRDGDRVRQQPVNSEIRPLPYDGIINYAPMFYGKRGVINED